MGTATVGTIRGAARFRRSAHGGFSTSCPQPADAPGGEGPIGVRAVSCYFALMNPLILILLLILLFGGGGFYIGGPMVGGGGLGLILLVCLIIYLMGGLRSTKN